jgi:hypothetical protein
MSLSMLFLLKAAMYKSFAANKCRGIEKISAKWWLKWLEMITGSAKKRILMKRSRMNLNSCASVLRCASNLQRQSDELATTINPAPLIISTTLSILKSDSDSIVTVWLNKSTLTDFNCNWLFKLVSIELEQAAQVIPFTISLRFLTTSTKSNAEWLKCVWLSISFTLLFV